MSEREEYPAGVPCWVESLTDDFDRARAYYGELFGWTWHSGKTLPYFVARVCDRDVAGVAHAPEGVAPTWMTHVRVEDVAATADAAGRAGGTVLAGPMEIAPAGRMVVIADPSGAVLCGFEPGERRGAQRVNEPGAWAMSTLSTPDVERARDFYGEMFGWTTEELGPMTMFRLDGYVGGEPAQPVPRDVVAAMAPAGGGPARWDVDFWISDVDAAVAVTEAHGGEVISPVETSPPFRRARFADPAGARFSLSELAITR